MPLKDVQKQELVKMFRVEPRSIQDIAEIVGVHYVTASRWVKEMLGLGLIRELPFRRGKQIVYILAAETTDEGVQLIQVGNKVRTAAQLAVTQDNLLDPYKYAQSCLAYLYRRAMNQALGEGYQGIWTPVDIRGEMRAARDLLMTEIQVVEQLLLNEDIWQEGSAAQSAMGPHPNVAFLDEHAALVDQQFKIRNEQAKARENGNGSEMSP